MDGLYHCTTYDSLMRILQSGALYPSYCLEQASYLKWNPNFAFAMVCFADLKRSEVKDHMKTFSSDVYIKMKKSWAFKYHISPVVYYSEKSTLTNAIFKDMVMDVAKVGKKGHMYNAMNILMGLMKQYKGRYFDKKRNRLSDNEVCFYLEREWRYLPLVRSNEAYYLEESDYQDANIRNQKRQELIDNGHVLNFGWDDIIEIGAGLKKGAYIVNALSSKFGISKFEAASKVKLQLRKV